MIGLLANKRFLVLMGTPDESQTAFLQTLRAEYKAEISVLASPDRSPLPGLPTAAPADATGVNAVIGLAGWEDLMSEALLEHADGKKCFVCEKPPEAAAARLQEAGLQLRHLGIELRPEEQKRMKARTEKQANRAILIVAISMLITVIGIANAMLMSVTEHFREIGTMKRLGSLSSFVVKLFLIESSIIGRVGSILGALVGVAFPVVAYSYRFGLGSLVSTVFLDTGHLVVLLAYGGACAVVGVVLSILAGIYPARVAARMIPAVALSSHV